MNINFFNVSGLAIGLTMRFLFSLLLVLSMTSGVFGADTTTTEKSSVKPENIFLGYYSREGNNGKMAQTTGNNQYIKFYPEKKIVRLYIPFPYSKSIKPETINAALNAAEKKSIGSAYIRGKFGVLGELSVAHLDFYHLVDNQVMYDCGKAKPCRVTFDSDSMTVIKPGLVLEHKIYYELVDN